MKVENILRLGPAKRIKEGMRVGLGVPQPASCSNNGSRRVIEWSGYIKNWQSVRSKKQCFESNSIQCYCLEE